MEQELRRLRDEKKAIKARAKYVKKRLKRKRAAADALGKQGPVERRVESRRHLASTRSAGTKGLSTRTQEKTGVGSQSPPLRVGSCWRPVAANSKNRPGKFACAFQTKKGYYYFCRYWR